MATQRKSKKQGTVQKSSRSKPAPRATAASRKTAARKTPTVESLARKIVRVTNNPAHLKLSDLYAESCTSIEPGSTEPVAGLEGLEQKLALWQSMVETQAWKARKIWTKGNTIAIQWDAQLKFRDGRSVEFEEVAVHEVRGGKIVAERYYYDPAVLMPPPQPEALPQPPPPDPAPPPGSPQLDPIDL